MLQSLSGHQRLIYLDHNATTPLAPAVVEAMIQHTAAFGNPSSLYPLGREAAKALTTAREQVATLVNAPPETVVFTGTGSEADNLAIKGIALQYLQEPCHIITSQIEHSAVLAPCHYLERLGFAVTYLPVDGGGCVDPDDVRRHIRPTTRLISIMHANNETGVVQPIEAIGTIARESDILFHTDAIQTIGKLPIDLAELPIDLLSLTAHKFYGPKGSGALVVREGVRLHPLVHGGGQEAGVRAGTENVLGIVGLGAASALAQTTLEDATAPERQRLLRDRLYQGLLEIGEVHVNGDLARTLPGTLNVSFLHIKGDALATALGFEHIAVSTGSACHAHETKPSHVLVAMGVSEEWLPGSIRFSLGRSTTTEEIDQTLAVIGRLVQRFRRMSPRTYAA